MIYVALLRGINVGGNKKVDMKLLATAFEQAGMQSVSTYINSGNVIFSNETHNKNELVTILENVMVENFGFAVPVLLRDILTMKATVAAIPIHWKNDSEMKCDVMFLWDAIDSPQVIQRLATKTDIDIVSYVAGAIIWSVDRKNVTKSGITKLVGTRLYTQMTIRNCNTTRKLLERMNSLS